jgi:hypothetical protein
MNIECAVRFEKQFLQENNTKAPKTGEGNGGETKHHGSHDSNLLIMLWVENHFHFSDSSDFY